MFRGYYSFICDNFFTHSLSLSWPIASPLPKPINQLLGQSLMLRGEKLFC